MTATTNAPAREGSVLRAILWTAGTLTSMFSMGLAARELSAELAPHHVSVWRSAICLLLLAPIMLRFGFRPALTPKPLKHVARNTVHFGAQWCWFFGLSALPLAEVFAIEFTAPIWTALLACIFLGERLTGPRIAAILLGFAGIMIILRPGIAVIDPAALVVLCAAIGYSATYVITRSMMGSESALTVV